jgi:hypothetical protein
VLLQRVHRWRTVGDEHVGEEADKLCRRLVRLGDAAAGEANFHPHVAAVGPAQVLHTLLEGRETGLPFRIVGDRDEHTDPPHPLRLLRTRRQRPRCRRAAEQGDERVKSRTHGSLTPVCFAPLKVDIAEAMQRSARRLVRCATIRSRDCHFRIAAPP